VLSGRGLCDELITRPEESYRLWCVVVCDLETSRMGAPYIYDISSLRVKNVWRYAFTSLYVFIARWLIQPGDTFCFCSGWFDEVGDDSVVPFSSMLFSFNVLPVDVGMVSCKPSTK